MIRDINKDTIILSQPSVPATKGDISVGQDLLDTLKANSKRCVGMAANMIGVTKNIIIVQMGMMPVVMFNPSIIKKNQPYSDMEGCLSLTGERPVTRFEEIEVVFYDMAFKKHQQKFTGFVAQIIQHEVDHCAGVLI